MDDFLEKLKKDRDAVKAKEAAEYDAKIRQRNVAKQASSGQTAQASAQTEESLYAKKPSSSNPWAQKAYENQQKYAQLTRETPNTDPAQKGYDASGTALNRASKTVSGAAKGSGAGYVDLLGLMMQSLGKANTSIRNYQNAEEVNNAYDNIARYEQQLRTASTQQEKDRLQSLIRSNQNRLKAMGALTEFEEQQSRDVAEKLYGTADKLAASSQADIEEAKEGLGTVGQFAVDLGVAGTQMVGDAALGGLPAMFLRSAGSSAQEARQSGASFGQQVAYGLGSGALSVATEKIANVAGPFRKVFGEGLANKAAGKLIAKYGETQAAQVMSRLAGTAGGKAILSAISEGGEEVLEDLVQPILKRATYDPNASFDAGEAGRDFLLGAALGGFGAGVEQAGRRIAGSGQKGTVEAAGTRAEASEGTSMGAAQNAVQGATSPSVQAEAEGRTGSPAAAQDALGELLAGGKRVDQSKLTQEQFDAAVSANEQGSVGMDADGKVYRVDPEQHIDRRTVDSVSGRSVNAFQFDHPEVHEYYRMAANALIADADLSLQFPMSRSYERTMQGNKVNQSAQASAHLRRAMDETGLSRSELIDAAQRIVEDHGQENVKAAKQVEIILDYMLTNGWTTMTGETVAPNQAYMDAKSTIAGSQPQVESGEELPVMDDGLGNANAGTVNSAFDDMQAKADTFHPVNPNSAQRIMNDQNRAPSEVPTVNPDTGKNIEKTVSTILNSPLTSPEMAAQIESAVADGQFDYIPVTDRGAHLRAQQDLSNRGLQAVADSFIFKVELGQRITKNDTASAIAAYNQAVADGNHALAFDLMTAIADAAHDSAQVVQSMNLMNRLTPEGRLLTMRKYVDKLNRQQSSNPGRRAANTNATQEQVDAARTNYVEQATGFRISDELASNYLMAETDAERAAAWDAITTDIASQIPSTFREKANFWRYTSMLLNPTTHARNFLGNLIQMGARKIKNAVGTGIERIAIRDQTQRTKSITKDKDLKQFAKGQYAQDQKAAIGNGKYSDASAAGIRREIQEKRKMFQGSNPLSRAVQGIGDFNTRLLGAEDVIFNRAAYVDSFAQALKAKGVTAAEAASGAKADLVAQARAYAIEEAQKATYRNSTALSEVLSKMGRYEGDNPVAKGLSFAADALMPFRRTPANILTTGMDYSPIGIAKAVKDGLVDLRNGNCTAADVVDSLSSGLTGTGILLLGAYLAAEDVLKVRTGDDDREEAFNKDAGMQEYALQIGDKSYTLDWALPAAMPLFAGAAIMESAGEKGSSFEAVADAMTGISEVVLETSMLSSLNDLISNWSYADNKATYLLDRTVTSYAGQYVPTIGGKIASAMDDTVRKSYVEKGTGQVASDADYFVQNMEKKIPGARQNLQPKVDLWGNEVSNGSVGERLFESFLSPGYLNTVRAGKVDGELRRLAEATGSSAVYPAQAEKSFKVNGEDKILTAEEYTVYAKKVGQTRLQVVSALLDNQGYQRLSDEEKAKAVSDAYDYAAAIGKMAVSHYKPADSSIAKVAMNSVLPPATYILYKINADRDNNGSVTGTESALTLQELTGITDRQRGDAWAKANSSTKAEKNPFTGALPEAGIKTDTAIRVYDKYRTLSNADMKPKEKAAAFKQYVNGLGLTGKQLAAVRSTYTFFGSYPVEW